MKKYKIAIFFNNERGLNVYIYLRKSNKFHLDVYISKKNLNKKILKKIPKRYKLIKKFETNIISHLKKQDYYLNIAAGWPLIFPPKVINLPEKGTINLHAGKLPEYRGGSPLNWQIIEGKKKIFISIIKMTKKLDAGPLYNQSKISFIDTDNINDLHKKVNKIYPIITKKVIERIIRNIKPVNQSKKNIRCLKQRNEYDGKIEWNKMDAEKVYNMVRALNKPYHGAYYIFGKKKFRIDKCKKSLVTNNAEPGTIFHIKKKKFITCFKNSVRILIEKKLNIN
jgi:methionyl-tRNA formyltransferase